MGDLLFVHNAIFVVHFVTIEYNLKWLTHYELQFKSTDPAPLPQKLPFKIESRIHRIPFKQHLCWCNTSHFIIFISLSELYRPKITLSLIFHYEISLSISVIPILHKITLFEITDYIQVHFVELNCVK